MNKVSPRQQNIRNKLPHIYIWKGAWVFTPLMLDSEWHRKLRLNSDASVFCAYLNHKRKETV